MSAKWIAQAIKQLSVFIISLKSLVSRKEFGSVNTKQRGRSRIINQMKPGIL